MTGDLLTVADLLQYLIQREDWMDDAACRDQATSLFFPERGHSHRPAKAICNACPVGSQCWDYSERSSSDYGIWNGVTKQPRKDPDQPTAAHVEDPVKPDTVDPFARQAS